MSKVCTLRSQGTGSQRGDGLGEPRWGQGCQHLEGHLHSPALHLPRPHIINHGLLFFFFFLWSLDVSAGKKSDQKTDARERDINVLDPKEVVALTTGST